MEMEATFRETAAEPRTESVGLSHLSLELGHLYMEDLAAGPEVLHAQFARVAPWARTARETCPTGSARRRPRISTCVLIDDYFSRAVTPSGVLPALLDAAREHGLDVDYVARESACAVADGVPLAALVAGHISESPPPDTDGSRPPASKVGWLANGKRSPRGRPSEAMQRVPWAPPSENGARNHSVFVDVELWSGQDSARKFSCAHLAATWQLLRLGMLRNEGRNVVHPQPWSDDFPDDWEKLPPIIQLKPDAHPFCAYRTTSVLPTRFLPTEHAVRVILEQVAYEEAVAAQIAARSRGEGIALPLELTRRIEYIFFHEP